MTIEPPVPADVLRLFQRMGAAADADVTRLNAGQHELYRIGVGQDALVLKVILDDADAARREILARELFTDAGPISVALRQGRIRGSGHYLVTPWADGVPLSTAMVRHVGFPIDCAFKSAGAQLEMLHSRSNSLNGQSRRVFPAAPAVDLGFGASEFIGRFGVITATFRERFGRSLWDRVEAALQTSIDSCRGPLAEVVLCHGDFQPKNLIFDLSGHLVAVIDWELAVFAPKLADLAHLLRYSPSEAIDASLAEGYAGIGDLADDWTTAARSYDLARVSLGLNRADMSTTSDIPLWIEFVEGCVDALLLSDPTRVRQAALPFLISTA
jgi:Phosphotransferase enzyme family